MEDGMNDTSDPEKSAEIWGDPEKRKWYRLQFSLYLTEEQASSVRINFDHLVNAMSKDFQGAEPVSPDFYIDEAQAMFEEPVGKFEEPGKYWWWLKAWHYLTYRWARIWLR
jgi:hypothetical protein